MAPLPWPSMADSPTCRGRAAEPLRAQIWEALGSAASRRYCRFDHGAWNRPRWGVTDERAAEGRLSWIQTPPRPLAVMAPRLWLARRPWPLQHTHTVGHGLHEARQLPIMA